MFAQVGKEDFSGCQAKQLVGSLISMFSETESSDVWHVSMQMELLLNF